MKKGEAASGRLHLFTMRLWKEALDGDRFEWRGRIEFIETGEVRYFREDTAFFSWLLAHFSGIDAAEPGAH